MNPVLYVPGCTDQNPQESSSFEITNKFYASRITTCNDCNKQIEYVFEINKHTHVCRLCAAIRRAKAFEGADWETLDTNEQRKWERSVVDDNKYFKQKTPNLKASTMLENLRKHPFLYTATRHQKEHPEIIRLIDLGKTCELGERHIKNLKWLIANLDSFTDAAWLYELQKKIVLLSMCTSHFRGYYNSLLKYSVKHKYLTEKQYKSVIKNWERFRNLVAKKILKGNFIIKKGWTGAPTVLYNGRHA